MPALRAKDLGGYTLRLQLAVLRPAVPAIPGTLADRANGPRLEEAQTVHSHKRVAARDAGALRHLSGSSGSGAAAAILIAVPERSECYHAWARYTEAPLPARRAGRCVVRWCRTKRTGGEVVWCGVCAHAESANMEMMP